MKFLGRFVLVRDKTGVGKSKLCYFSRPFFSYLKLVLHRSNVLDQFRDSISQNVLRCGVRCGLDLEDEVVIERMGHLVSCEEHFGILQQLPI